MKSAKNIRTCAGIMRAMNILMSIILGVSTYFYTQYNIFLAGIVVAFIVFLAITFHAIMIGLADIVDNTYKIANNRASVE